MKRKTVFLLAAFILAFVSLVPIIPTTVSRFSSFL
jgi:hypothetical protein